MNEPLFFKLLPMIVHVASFFLAVIAGILVYTGLSTSHQRKQARLRLRNSLIKSKLKYIEASKETQAEKWLNRTGYPLGLNGFRYHIFLMIFGLSLLIYYVFIPFFSGENVFFPFILIILLLAFLLPNNPYSIFVLVMKRVLIYHQAKINAEVFMLYDLLIIEIEMMTNTRINSYSVLRSLKPYFQYLQKPMTSLLSSWSSNEGPKVALDQFQGEINTKEVKALVSVIKTLDEVSRETALESLKGMHNMFMRGQIENYRRRRKVTTDLLSLPIKATHMLIIVNFIMVIVTMVAVLLEASHK